MESRFKLNMLIGTLALSALLVSSGTSMANLALPAISAEFSLSFSAARWIVLSYLLAITLLSLVVGRVGDINGRRNILLWGLALFNLGTIASSFSFSLPVLLISRVLQGVGAAALAVLPIAIVTDVLSKQKMGRALGFLATMSAIGTATGPSIGGILIAEFGWRSVFSALTALGVFTLLLALKFVRLNEHSSHLDQPGHFIDSIRAFYSDSSVRVHLFSNLAISAVMVSTLIVGPFYLTHVLHLDPRHMGLVISAGPITSILSGTVAGYAVDRFGCRLVIKIGFVQALVGTISFIFLPKYFGSLGFVLSAILLSSGYQLFLSANSNSFMKNSRAEHRGVAAGALNLSRNLGLISGTYLIGGIFSHPTEKTISDGFQVTFSVAAFLIAFMLISQLKHQKRRTYGKRFVN
ncbi:MFS transporter [Bdellovibrio bacteriovorus]|uniref:MFS transporter n=1 Tax=Bdellovibrio bacteriovorus TaxID=959 RepID=UPI0035A6103F